MPTKKVLSPSVPKKKPSLASLKPDKASNIRARKKAVKKIEAHVTKKTTTKKSPIVAKKKTETTGLAVKRAVKSKKQKSLEESPVLVLPPNMSIRAREKALAILEQVTKDFSRPAQQVAYASGLCFMLVGATMSLAFSGTLSPDNQSAQLASSTLQTTTTTTTNIVKTVLPEVSLLDPLPRELTATTEHKLAVLNVKNAEVRARSLDTGKIISLPIDDLSSELYKFALEKDKFAPGRYSIVVLVESAIDGSKHDFKLGEIIVPTTVSQTTSNTSGSSSTTTTNTTTTSSGTSNSGSSTVDETEEEEVEEVVSALTTTISDVASTTTATPVPSVGPSLRLIAPSGSLVGNVLIKVDAPKDLSFIELYARPPQSSNSRFIGLAEKRLDYWYFFFDTKNVPNGDYEITARTRSSGKEYLSPGVKVRIANFLEVTSDPVATELAKTEDPELVSDDTDIAEVPTGRSLPDFSLTNITDDGSESLTPVPLTVQDVLALYNDDIRTLLNRYAVAQQSGDATAIELARKELQAGKRAIIEDILADKTINYLADDAEKILDERFAILQKRVETFEDLRKTASSNNSAIDTDKDGISDFDEQNLYNTDPTLPDTDNDGVIDGVEIMRGFDPLSNDVEAVITYELPEESFGIVREDLFKVESIVPLIKNDDEEGKSVQAEIVGKALPNSYVTLYVFSTPTIVTVRADENGAFKYTFEKELEDGNHEIYVAITDNTGAIVARSNPFRFIKEAEAFTPIDGTAGVAENATTITIAPFNTYNVVIGLGILAFGIILLMLGIGMREKDTLGPDQPSHDLKTS